MIPKIKHILYATDLSRNSAYAFQYAIHFAALHQARISLLHVLEKFPGSEDPYISSDLMHGKMDKIVGTRKIELSEKIQKRLIEFCRKELQGDPALLDLISSVKVVEGEPAGQILHMVQDLKADLLIMGTHSKDFLTHAMLGSVSEGVLRRIKIPVTIIPIPEKTDLEFHDFA